MGCSEKASEEVDFGTIENSVYKNKYFGLSITIPDEWSIQDQNSRERMAKLGTELIAGDDSSRKAVMKVAELQTVHLLAAFKHPIGTPVAYNPNISCLADRIRHMPGIKRGKDYHFHARKLLESGQLEVSFPGDISTEKLGGVAFDVMHVQVALAGMTFQQKYYATVMKGYALLFVVSFTTDEEKAALDKVLDSVVFK